MKSDKLTSINSDFDDDLLDDFDDHQPAHRRSAKASKFDRVKRMKVEDIIAKKQMRKMFDYEYDDFDDYEHYQMWQVMDDFEPHHYEE